MFLRQRVKELEEANEMCDKGFNDVHADMGNVIRDLQEMYSQFTELRVELATNGAIRDIRDLQKRVAFLEDENQKLKTNGVATAINKLNEEVFSEKKESELGLVSPRYFYQWGGMELPEPEQEATLAGKVDAIIEHLGLDVTVKPEKVSEAKVVAKRKVTKKKGKK